jgi:hypothetical protein
MAIKINMIIQAKYNKKKSMQSLLLNNRFGGDKKSELFIFVAVFSAALIINPILSIIYILIFLPTINNKKIINLSVYITIIGFVHFLYNREYGVAFSEAAADDVISYLWHYKQLQNIGAGGGDSYFFILGYSEPAYLIFSYITGYLTGFNNKFYLLINYFISSALFIVSLRIIFNRYYFIVFLLCVISSDFYMYQSMHIFRQSIGMGLMILSITLINNVKNRKVFYIIALAALTHYVYFLFACMLYIYNKKYTCKLCHYLLIVGFISLLVIFKINLEGGYMDKLREGSRFLFVMTASMIFSLLIYFYASKDQFSNLLFFILTLNSAILMIYADVFLISARLFIIHWVLFIIGNSYLLMDKFKNKSTNKIPIYILLMAIIGVIYIMPQSNSMQFLLGGSRLYELNIIDLLTLVPIGLDN